MHRSAPPCPPPQRPYSSCARTAASCATAIRKPRPRRSPRCVRLLTSAARRRVATLAQARKTVPGELKRLLAAGAIDDATYAERRAAYDDAKRTVKKLSGRRALELGAVVKTLEGVAARGQLSASRLAPLFLTLQRNREWWTNGAAAELRPPRRLRGLPDRLAVLPRRRHPDPGARHLRQGQRALVLALDHGARAGRRRAAAARRRARRRRGLGVLLRLPRGQGPVGLEPRPGHRAAGALARRDAAAPRGRGVRGHRPRAEPLRARRARGRARAGRRRRALRAVLLRAGPADPQRLRPVARRPLRLRAPGRRRPREGPLHAGRGARAGGGPDLRHRGLVAVLARHGHARVRPRLPHAAARLPRVAVQPHQEPDLLRRRGPLHRRPHDPAGGQARQPQAARRRLRADQDVAGQDLRRDAADHARREARPHALRGEPVARAAHARLGGAQAGGRLHGRARRARPRRAIRPA